MRHECDLRVRFGDTDMLGHVNNASFFTFMEEARIRFLEEAVQESGMPLILASAKVDFRAQTFFGQTLRIESWVSRIGNSSFDIACHMLDSETGVKVFEGVAVIVYFDYEAQQATPIPTNIRAKLMEYQEY